MREIGAFAAKTHLSQLLESVSEGESFAITKHGHVVALLVPVLANERPNTNISEMITKIIVLRKKISKRGVKLPLNKIQQLKETGRK